MYNIRYHIASLVAVFLALTVGLVLGGLVVGRGAIDDQQAQLIDGLRNDLNELTADKAALEGRLTVQDEFAGQAAARLVAGSLSGRRIAILTNTGRSDGLAAAEDAIEAAGGVPVVITLEQPGLGLSDDAVRSALPTLAAEPDALETVAAAVAAEWSRLGPRPVTAALESAEVLDAGALSDGPISGVVAMASFDDEPDEGAIALAVAAKADGVASIGAQRLAMENGVAQAAAEAGLGATNVLGTPAGVYAVASLLNDATLTGLYGVGPGAGALVPPAPSGS